MTVTQEQLDSFHRFASEKLGNGDSELTWQELLEWWRVENPTPEEQREAHAAIREGLADVEAGRYRPAEEVMDELYGKHNLPSE